MEFTSVKQKLYRYEIHDCRYRCRMACFKFWTMQRFAWTTVILGIVAMSCLSTWLIADFWTREYRHATVYGECVELACHLRPNPRQETMLGLESCCCNTTFMVYAGNYSQYETLICGFAEGRCKQNGSILSYDCWLDANQQIWKSPPDFWILRTLVMLGICALGLLWYVLMIMCTSGVPEEILPHQDMLNSMMDRANKMYGIKN